MTVSPYIKCAEKLWEFLILFIAYGGYVMSIRLFGEKKL